MAVGPERRMRIVVVDDYVDFIDLMRELLSAEYDVVALTGQRISADAVIESRPDLLMVDLRLDTPDLQGWDIVTRVRKNRDLRAIPIIVCSADARALNERASAFRSISNVAVLPKPFTVEDLEATLRHGLATAFADEQVAAIG
jgi:CheY-like chemotaxis protein